MQFYDNAPKLGYLRHLLASCPGQNRMQKLVSCKLDFSFLCNATDQKQQQQKGRQDSCPSGCQGKIQKCLGRICRGLESKRQSCQCAKAELCYWVQLPLAYSPVPCRKTQPVPFVLPCREATFQCLAKGTELTKNACQPRNAVVQIRRALQMA